MWGAMTALTKPKSGQPTFEKSSLGGRYITKEQLAEYLACSTRQIEKLVKAGAIPAKKFGRRMIRFSTKAVEAALEK